MAFMTIRRWAVLTAVGAQLVRGTASAQTVPAPASAPISDIRYELTIDSAHVGRRQLGVVMTFDVRGAAPVLLSLPAWSPGHYVLL